ncbi:VIT1/CCC1 transporter family protein [Corynebacterium jeikeium]|uniref:VIT1/CCC1 transporter family protein n=1 Tax=Corynebacterium jeikeium TaxID=38289 RepID=UPI000DA30C1B|nr:VIT1/CCC1 transporter family protein [Corynebacterium jeikeium]SQI23871.1 iron and manganese transporter [Corynebacterium jeikeium]
MSTSVSCPCDRYYDGLCTAVATCERGIITIPTAEVTAPAERPELTAPAEHAERADVDDNQGESLNRLRAAVLGGNDGIVSTAAVLVGVAGATSNPQTIAMSGLAAVIGGAVSMALGEYVSVSSQRDSERAMGMSQLVNPWSAGIASFISFILGAALPFAAALFAPVAVIFGVTFVALALTGALSAHLSNVPKTRAMLRIVIGGMAALAVTFAVGSVFGAAI